MSPHHDTVATCRRFDHQNQVMPLHECEPSVALPLTCSCIPEALVQCSQSSCPRRSHTDALTGPNLKTSNMGLRAMRQPAGSCACDFNQGSLTCRHSMKTAWIENAGQCHEKGFQSPHSRDRHCHSVQRSSCKNNLHNAGAALLAAQQEPDWLQATKGAQ